MKRVLCLAVLLLLLSAVTASAGEFDWVVGASIGYISSNEMSPALIFNAYRGQSLLLTGLPMTYPSTEGYCGLAPFTSSGSIIAAGYSSDFIFVTAPIDDLYMFVCVKVPGGLPGDLLLVAADNYLLGMISAASVKTDAPQALKDRLAQEIVRVRGK